MQCPRFLSLFAQLWTKIELARLNPKVISLVLLEHSNAYTTHNVFGPHRVYIINCHADQKDVDGFVEVASSKKCKFKG